MRPIGRYRLGIGTMESHDIQAFEDPALKAALRRHFCGECCPARLRERIARAARGGQDESRSLRIGSAAAWSVGPSLAMAASLLVAIGLVGYLLSTSPHPNSEK